MWIALEIASTRAFISQGEDLVGGVAYSVYISCAQTLYSMYTLFTACLYPCIGKASLNRNDLLAAAFLHSRRP